MELVTTIPTKYDVDGYEAYDAVYLGMPYCWEYDGNLISDLKVLKEVAESIDKKVYVTTFAAPRNKDLERVYKLVDFASDFADAIEVTNLGIAKYISEEYDIRIHVGGLANVYTRATAEFLKSIGIKRIMPAYELPIEDIEDIKRSGVEVEVVVHGKIPLGIGHECFIRKFSDIVGVDCPDICKKDLYFKSDDLILIPLGQATYSGKDVCMYEHIEKLGFIDAARIEVMIDGSEYRRKVGEIYRRRISSGFIEEDFEELKRLSRFGLCNGFFFNKPGQVYVPR